MAGRMLERDYYLADFTRQYLPQKEEPTLRSHFNNPFSTPSLFMFTSHEFKELSISFAHSIKYPFVALAISLMGIGFYKRLPLLKLYPNLWVRFPVSIAMLSVPVMLNAHYLSTYEKLVRKISKQKANGYRQYILTGDLRYMNADCVLEELPANPAANHEATTL